jgi:ankyrin repeat protein
MIACYKGHLEIAKYLIGLGANVNRKSVKGNTALHDCAESGSLQIMKLLLAHGATIDVDSYGKTFSAMRNTVVHSMSMKKKKFSTMDTQTKERKKT